MLTFVILTIIFAACAIIYDIIGAAKEPGSQTVNKPRPTVRVTVGTPEKDVPVRSLRYFCVKDKGYNVTVWPKDQYIGDYLEFKIAGITHGEHVSEHLGEFVATLEPEPTNPYDPNAIRIVTSEGHRVGYIPRNMTDRIRDFATLPCPCYCYIGTNDGIYFSDCYISRI